MQRRRDACARDRCGASGRRTAPSRLLPARHPASPPSCSAQRKLTRSSSIFFFLSLSVCLCLMHLLCGARLYRLPSPAHVQTWPCARPHPRRVLCLSSRSLQAGGFDALSSDRQGRERPNRPPLTCRVAARSATTRSSSDTSGAHRSAWPPASARATPPMRPRPLPLDSGGPRGLSGLSDLTACLSDQ